MKIKIFLSTILCILTFSVFGAIPSGYYNSTEGKKAAILKTELHKIICQDTTHYLGYGSGKGNTWEGFYYTDRNLITNAVIDMYSDSVRYFPNPNPSFTAFGSAIEIEHSLPKSWWGCDITHPDCPAKDLHQLYPADGTANMSKNDNPLGIVTGTPTTNNGVSKVGPGNVDGSIGTVFEPADQYKGDFARSYFYMATAYEHYAAKWDISKPENMMQNSTYPVFKTWALDLLLQWHRQDPVSEKELTRTEVVYGIQKNRNPFIDYPDLVEYVWGNKKTIPFLLSGNVNFPYLSYPSNEDIVDFGKVFYLQTADYTINLKGMNLTGDLSVALSGTNAVNFSVDKTSITKAIAEAGMNLVVTFSAQINGSKSAQLTISGGGIAPVIIQLNAIYSDEFVALPASNILNNSFTANWSVSPNATGYNLNVFKLRANGLINPVTILEESFGLFFPNNWIKEGSITWTAPSGSGTYGTVKFSSGTSYGKITLPALDFSAAPSILTVRARQFSNDTGAKLTATLDGLTLTVWTTAVANQDFTVTIPKGSNAGKIALSTVTGKRVYMEYVKVVAQVPALVPVSITDYPKSVGNVLTYTIEGLQSDSTYYYSVLPVGNSSLESNKIKVRTGISTGVVSDQISTPSWSVSSEGILVRNIPKICKLSLLDMMGRKIKSFEPYSSEMMLTLPQKGLYLLQIQSNNTLKTVKLLY